MAAALRSTRSSEEKRGRDSPTKGDESAEYQDERHEALGEVDNGEEFDEEEEEEAETRCICGEMDPPDENGLFIQCEKCQVWQHGFCVSIDVIVPEKYWCELCKPELHSIIIRPSGKISKYLPVQPKESREAANQRRKNRKTNSGQAAKTTSEEEYDLSSRRKKERATYNSREEARYEAMIQRVMEESKKDAKTDTMDDEKSNSRSSRSSRRRRNDEEDDENEQPDETQNDDTEMKDDEDGGQAGDESKDIKKEMINDALKEEDDASSSNTRSKKTNDSESNESTNSKQKRSNKKRARKPAGSRKPVNGSPQKAKDTAIDFSKPTKPRLPQQRTTMNEMRKRVAAILEFIGRTQLDLATEQEDEKELTKYVEDSKSKETIEKLFQNYNGSLELMDALTRKLLIWEQKFGKLGEN